MAMIEPYKPSNIETAGANLLLWEKASEPQGPETFGITTGSSTDTGFFDITPDIWSSIPQEDKASYFISERVVSASTPWFNFIAGTHWPRTEIILHPSAEPLLPERTREALNLLLNVLLSEAQRLYVPVIKTEVRGFIDPEEGDQELVISQLVSLSPRAAMSYWDKLGITIAFWLESLPSQLAAIITDRIAVEIHWNNDTAF